MDECSYSVVATGCFAEPQLCLLNTDLDLLILETKRRQGRGKGPRLSEYQVSGLSRVENPELRVNKENVQNNHARRIDEKGSVPC